jgi:hypothetical protein
MGRAGAARAEHANERVIEPLNQCANGSGTSCGVLTEIDCGIWVADGPPVPFLGVPYPTRMTVVRLPGAGLWVCSPIRLDQHLRDAVSARGRVEHLVSPNKLHHLYLADWAQAWPNARLYASPGLAKRRRDLSFTATLGDEPDPAWAADIDQVIVRGSIAMQEVVFFHRKSRTAIVTDLVQRFAPATLHGWRRLMMTLDGLVGPDGSTPREWRLSFWNRAAARRAKRKILDWDPQRVIVAHGEWIHDNGRAVVERALAWMG